MYRRACSGQQKVMTDVGRRTFCTCKDVETACATGEQALFERAEDNFYNEDIAKAALPTMWEIIPHVHIKIHDTLCVNVSRL